MNLKIDLFEKKKSWRVDTRHRYLFLFPPPLPLSLPTPPSSSASVLSTKILGSRGSPGTGKGPPRPGQCSGALDPLRCPCEPWATCSERRPLERRGSRVWGALGSLGQGLCKAAAGEGGGGQGDPCERPPGARARPTWTLPRPHPLPLAVARIAPSP